MNTCKVLIRLGVFRALPYDAGTLLRLVKEEAEEHRSDKSFFYAASFDVGEKLTIDHDPNIYPFFRLWHDQKLAGYAVLFSDGVGRIMLVSPCDLLKRALRDLCSPCVCRAGHLLLQRLRVGSALACTCASSTLKSILHSASKSGQCPISFLPSVPFRVIQNHAIAVADQRLRISSPR